MADYGSEGRSSDGWSRAAVSSDVKTETDGCKPKYDERVMSIMEHDHSMNVEDNLFEMYYARFNHQLEETSKESEESDKNQLDTVEVKFVKHELHSRSSVSESEDAGRLSVVCEHYFGCGNRTQEEHKHLYDVKHQSELVKILFSQYRCNRFFHTCFLSLSCLLMFTYNSAPQYLDWTDRLLLVMFRYTNVISIFSIIVCVVTQRGCFRLINS
jgi:hypothetical protein